MIFGIGLPRTGTTSLTEALRVMGIAAAKWGDIHHPGLEQWYESDLSVPSHIEALIDTCFCRWYRTADQLFPGSRFILTTREKQDWLRSCDRWVSRYTPAPGTAWFNRRLFNTGRITFQPNVYFNLYDEHHELVESYFRERDDLLVLNIVDTADAELWQRLGQFLGRRTPDVPFPHTNQSK